MTHERRQCYVVINSNERRPDEIGDYYAEDSKGEKTLAPFVDGNWLSDTGHPIVKWLEESQASDKDKEIERLKHLAEYWEGCHREVGKDLIKIQQENNQLKKEIEILNEDYAAEVKRLNHIIENFGV